MLSVSFVIYVHQVLHFESGLENAWIGRGKAKLHVDFKKKPMYKHMNINIISELPFHFILHFNYFICMHLELCYF